MSVDVYLIHSIFPKKWIQKHLCKHLLMLHFAFFLIENVYWLVRILLSAHLASPGYGTHTSGKHGMVCLTQNEASVAYPLFPFPTQTALNTISHTHTPKETWNQSPLGALIQKGCVSPNSNLLRAAERNSCTVPRRPWLHLGLGCCDTERNSDKGTLVALRLFDLVSYSAIRFSKGGF